MDTTRRHPTLNPRLWCYTEKPASLIMAFITGSLELKTNTGGRYVFSKTKEGIHVRTAKGEQIVDLYIPGSAVSAFEEVLHKLNDFNYVF